jgi:hypothetical protein
MTTQVRITAEHVPGTKVRVVTMERSISPGGAPAVHSFRDLKEGETFVGYIYEETYFTVEEKPA